MSCYRDLTLDTPGPGQPEGPDPGPGSCACRTPYHTYQRTHLRHSGRRARDFCLPPGRYSRRARSVECCANCNRCRGALTTAAPPSGIAPTWLYRLSHRSARGAADEMRVLGEHAGERVGLRRPRRRAPAPQLRSRQVHADLAPCGIDADAVPAAQQPDRPADCRLGADVSNNKAVTAAGEAPVGDQSHLRSQASSGDGARRAEHLGHAGRPAWALLADHDYVAGAHPTGENRPGGALLALEHTRRPLEACPLLAGDLGDGALGGEVPVQDHEMAVLLHGVRQRTNNLLATHIHGNLFKILP